MRAFFLIILILFFSYSNALDDECSHRVKAYLGGLEFGSDDPKIASEVSRIKLLMRDHPDCYVQDQVPALKSVADAIQSAYDNVNK